MWKPKGCPRCGGDLFLDRDIYGWFEECLQCGRRSDLPDAPDSKRPPSEKPEPVLTGHKK